MAITKTRELIKIYIDYGRQDPIIRLTYRDTIDDPEDDQLPIFKDWEDILVRYPAEAQGGDGVTQLDVSSYDQIIQDIVALVWL